MTEIDNIKSMESFKYDIIHQNKNELKNLLNQPLFKDQVLESGMDLLSIICESIEETMIDFNNCDDVYCNLINFIAENGNPKEVICILNVHLDKVNVDFKFLILLYPLSIALQKLDLSHNSSLVILEDSLNCAVSYFSTLPVAHYKGLEGEELEVYIQTSETQRFLRLSKVYLGFIELMIKNEKFVAFKNVRNEIVKNILFLFDNSLIKLVFHSSGIVSEECRSCGMRAFVLVEQLVTCLHEYIRNICSNNQKLKQNIVQMSNEDYSKSKLSKEIIPYSSLVSLLYHIFVMQNFNKYPQVFLPIYNWNFSLHILSVCLEESLDPHVIRICLQLLNEFDHQIETSSIPWKRNIHLPFFNSLKITMTANFNREIRGSAFEIFVKYLNKFVVSGRFKILKSLLKETDHFGFKGQLILLLKKEIIDGINNKDENNRYFIGSSVYPLISDIFTLPDRDKTDVVNESEWILAALNMLYVVYNRDKQRLVGIDVLIQDFHKDFIQPLIKATELTWGHYNNEKTLMETDENSSTISELGTDLSFMSREQKIDFLDKALLNIELVKCNLSRITNLL